tara:strand:- start:166 stop:561 length:396 start_codon:yes stop_codon:yes gene_type:complete
MKFEYKFEHHWGGKDNWYIKSSRWAKKQPFPLNHLITGFIEWLHKLWIDGKILKTMADVDKDIESIKSTWEENDRQSTPHIVETGVFGDEGWSLEITNPIVERRTDSTSTGMAPPSDAQRLQENEGDKGTS